MDSQKFDELIPEISNKITNAFLLEIEKLFKNGNADTSPLLNMTTSVFMSSLLNILDCIKKSTIGEVELIQNIELMETTLVKAIGDLPFINKVEFID